MRSARTLAEVAAIGHTEDSHIPGLVEVVGRTVVEENMIATKRRRRRLPTDLHPPVRAQGRFLLVSGSSTVEMRPVSRPERKLLRDPGGLYMVNVWATSRGLKQHT